MMKLTLEIRRLIQGAAVSVATTLALFTLTSLAGAQSSAPYIRVTPLTDSVAVGGTIDVQLTVDTGTGAARAVGIVLLYDPAVLELIDGVSGITKSSGSPFNLSPPPAIPSAGEVQIALLEPSFASVTYSGAVVDLQFQALAASAGTTVSFDTSGSPANTRFSPDIAGTNYDAATYTVTSGGGGGSSFSILPASGSLSVGSTQQITIHASTGGGTARGAGIEVIFDPAVFTLVGGVSGITKPAGSPFNLAPPPAEIAPGNYQIPLGEPSLNLVTCDADVVTFQLQAIAPAPAGSAITFDASVTRFSPNITPVTLSTSSLTVTGTATDDSRESGDGNDGFAAAANDTPLAAGSTTAGLVLQDDDWYPISISASESVMIKVLFNGNQGDLNCQLYDARGRDSYDQPYRVGVSYSPRHPWIWDPGQSGGQSAPTFVQLPWGPASANDEWIPYLNTTGATLLYLRCYGEEGATNPNYSIKVESLGTDDAYEPNDWASTAKPLNLNQEYANLMLREDDWFKFNATGHSELEVQIAEFAGLAVTYFEVWEDLGGTAGRKLTSYYVPNQHYEVSRFSTQGVSSVLLRIYAATPSPNLYTLKVVVPTKSVEEKEEAAAEETATSNEIPAPDNGVTPTETVTPTITPVN